jgi:hypothetical protein
MGAALHPEAFEPHGLPGTAAGHVARTWRAALANAIAAWTGVGGGRQTLYVTAHALYALRREGTGWICRAAFALDGAAETERGPAGAATAAGVPDAFRGWISAWRGDAFCFLLDGADEEMEADELPNVRGRDREKVLDRRLKQRFRDAALTAWSVPHGGAAKKDAKTPATRECTLLVGVRQRNPMLQWIEAAQAAGARISSVESVALRSAALLRASGAGATALLATVVPAGLRQTLVHDGAACFTRLQPMDGGAPWERVADELDRTVRFLMMSRAALRPLIQAGKVPVVVVADGIADTGVGGVAATALPLRDSTIPVRWIGSRPARASRGGAERHPATAPTLGGLPLFLDGARGTRTDYANADIRRNWRHSRSLAAGWGFATLALLVALGANLFLQTSLNGRMDAVGARPRMAAVEATRLQAQQLQQQLAARAVSAEEMDAVVRLAAQLRSRHVDAPQTLRWIGEGLAHDPAVNLDEISWEPARPLAGAAAPTAAASAAAPATVAGTAAVDPASSSAAAPTTVRISGYVDPDISKALANSKIAELLARLQAGCHCDGKILVPPYDPSMDVAYAASLRDSTRVASPRFTLELERPVPEDAPPSPAGSTGPPPSDLARHG